MGIFQFFHRIGSLVFIDTEFHVSVIYNLQSIVFILIFPKSVFPVKYHFPFEVVSKSQGVLKEWRQSKAAEISLNPFSTVSICY